MVLIREMSKIEKIVIKINSDIKQKVIS